MRAYENLKVPQLVFGSGTAKQTGKRLKALGVTKCMVVADKGILSIGLVDPILQSLKDAQIDYVMYDRVQPEPPDYSCIEAAELLKSEKCDCTLAIGGGSSIDTAKAANLIAAIPEKIEDLHDYSVLGTKMKPTYARTVKFVVIPTTSGTGAEATGSAVISDTKRGLKFSFKNPSSVADMNIIDPMLTVGMPARQTIVCGLDALCHIVEDLVGTRSNDFTELVLLDALNRVWKWLPIAVREPKNVEAREQLAWAAHYALCSGGIPNGHAAGHAIGALYHLVHGHACIVVLPTVIRHHAQTSAEIIRKIAEVIGVPTTEEPEVVADRVATAISDLYKSLGLRPVAEELRAKGIEDDRETFIKKVVPAMLDDFKSHEWRPAIHEDYEAAAKVCGMIYDDQ